MPAIFITLIMNSVAFLLSIDSKIKALLDNACWFNSLQDLTTNNTPDDGDDMDAQMAQNWSSLWDCAGQALHINIEHHFYLVNPSAQPASPSTLGCRKRTELTFCSRNTSLHQLVLCRHASGSDGDHLPAYPSLFIKHNARFRHCAFLLSELIREDALCTLFVSLLVQPVSRTPLWPPKLLR